MARCSFCGGVFKSSQSVRAHLRFCRAYKHRRPNPSAPPRARRATTEEEDLRRLWRSASPSMRTPTAPHEIEPRRAAARSTPRRDPERSQELIAQEYRRQQEALREEQRQHAVEQRVRAAQQRTRIQHIKMLVVDMYFTREPIPPEAIAEAKEQIERTLTTLPILDLPLWEVQQIATGVRELVFARYRKPPTPTSVAVPSRSDDTQTTLHSQPKEAAMPMQKVLSGYFICPRCDEEYELDRIPEHEALCKDCRAPLEELAEEDEEDDGE